MAIDGNIRKAKNIGARCRSALIIALITLVSLETAASLAFYFLQSQSFTHETIRIRRKTILGESITSTSSSDRGQVGLRGGTRYMLHPYLGFVWQPEDSDSKNPGEITPYGHYGEVDPFIASRNSHVAIVGIAGGSVAEHLYKNSRDTLRAFLQDLPVFRDKQIIFIMLGMSTYEQPQSLLALSYYLALGGRLDLLVNLDGKNEATNSYVNFKNGVFPAFPYQWAAYFRGVNPDSAQVVGKIALVNEIRKQLARCTEFLDFSITASTLWFFIDRRLEGFVNSSEGLLYAGGNELPSFISGPKVLRNISEDDLRKFQVNLWRNASKQFQLLAQGNLFPYFHFLQPNQYVPNSKQLTENELKWAYLEDSDHNRTVRNVYPLFEDALRELRSEGVYAYSLTSIFEKVTDSIYVDNCCHLNNLGNELLAQAVGERIKICLSAGDC